MPELVCDFCNGDGVTWSYPAKDFRLIFNGVNIGTHGAWAACDDCHRAIEERGVEGSIDRTVCSLTSIPEGVVRQYATLLHNAFFERRTGPAVPYKE
jgi:hypothetical protein